MIIINNCARKKSEDVIGNNIAIIVINMINDKNKE